MKTDWGSKDCVKNLFKVKKLRPSLPEYVGPKMDEGVEVKDSGVWLIHGKCDRKEEKKFVLHWTLIRLTGRTHCIGGHTSLLLRFGNCLGEFSLPYSLCSLLIISSLYSGYEFFGLQITSRLDDLKSSNYIEHGCL